MKILELLHGSNVEQSKHSVVWQDPQFEVSQVSIDSRKVTPGTLFLCAEGATEKSAHGKYHIREALEKGACAIVVESVDELEADISVPVFIAKNCRKLGAFLSEKIHDFPSKKMAVFGITGTNGKTTSTFYLASLLEALGKQAGVLGTLGLGSVKSPISTGYTTPEAEILSASLASLADDGFTHIAMEVSSHGLELFRCDGIHFSAAGFTNLTQDHLDFHGDMDSYRRAKERLFLELLPESSPAVLPLFEPLVEKVKSRGRRVVTFGESKNADISVSESETLRDETRVRLSVGSESQVLHLPIFGAHNLENVMVASGLAFAHGFSPSEIFRALPQIKAPPGRFERVLLEKNEGLPLVLVDFAHTPDALQNVLALGRTMAQGKLKLVFGCGGNRDKAKRPLMGKIAAELADEIWITNDNPRNEEAEQIAQDILKGIDESLRHKVKIVLERKAAIDESISNSKVNDVVILAGKGHEDTQEIHGKKYPFSDISVAKSVLEAFKS